MQAVDHIKEYFRDPKAREIAVLLWDTMGGIVGKGGIGTATVAHNLMHRIPTHVMWDHVSGAVMPHLLLVIQYAGESAASDNESNAKLLTGLAVNSMLNVLGVLNREVQPLVSFSILLNKLGNGEI